MAQSDPNTERAKKVLESERKAQIKSSEEYAGRMKGKPTPTQEENDLQALGAHIHPEHEADGSNPDPHVSSPGEVAPTTTRHLEGGKPSSYQTRAQKSE